MRHQPVELAKILFHGPDALRYAFTYRPDLDDLVSSIQNTGLLVPPVLREREAGSFQIVCGFRRIQALRRLGATRTDAFVVSREEWSEVVCLRRSIQENQWHRGFNDVERARLFTRLQDEFIAHLPCLDDILVEDLKIPRKPKELEPYRFILSLPEPILDGLAQGSISMGQALLLKQLPTGTRGMFFKLMAGCALTLQESRKAAQWLPDITGREQQRPDAVLTDYEVLFESLLKENLPPRHKAQKLLSLLREKRYPLLESWKTRFESARAQTGLQGKGIMLSHDPTFETTRIRIQIQAESETELIERVEQLSKAAREEKMKTLFLALSVNGKKS